MTSLAFMFVDVPEPVWYTSIGNASSCAPSATACAASAMAAATSRGRTPRSAFVSAAARLTSARARMNPRGIGWPEIGKFMTARCVVAP